LVALLPIVHHKVALVLDILELVLVADLVLFIHLNVLFLVVITEKLPSVTELTSNINYSLRTFVLSVTVAIP